MAARDGAFQIPVGTLRPPASNFLDSMPDLMIVPAVATDLPEIRAVYADARALQRAEGSLLWPEFTDESILGQIDAGTLYRVLDGDTLAGVFTVAYEDPAIWGTLDRGEHVYLHRIARSASYEGRGLVAAVTAWSRAHCREHGRRALRMDTWASNHALIAYYARFGFDLVAQTHIDFDSRLPAHYYGGDFALLEERDSSDD